jgi:hypothetical protein
MARFMSQSCNLGARPSHALIVPQPCHHGGQRDYNCQVPHNVQTARRFKAVSERYGSWRSSPTSSRTGLCDHRLAT